MATCAVVKETLRIEDVIGQVVPLKRHGAWYVGRCPFHDDKHPSLVVWPKTGTWKCMTCSPMRDDVIGFVARWRQCSTAEALRLLGESLPTQPPRRESAAAAVPLASVSDRDTTYRRLLGVWGLTTAHRADLRARGLSDHGIRRAGFASVAPGRSPIQPTAAGVPGFARLGGTWRIQGPTGLAIPVRNTAGQVVAVHVRVDHPQAGKYRWLSTPTHPGGAASGAPVHVVRGLDDVVWVTEGPLKAIVAHDRLQHTVLGVPGIAAWHDVPDILATLRPKRVMLAFDQDADPQTAAAVTQQIQRLRNVLTAQLSVPVLLARWEGPNGLDDALVAKVPIRWE